MPDRIRWLRAGLLPLAGLLAGCAAGLSSGLGVSARSAAEADQPAIVQATVPFAILLVIGLLISRTFKSD